MILQSMSRAAAAGMPVSCGLTAEGDIFVLNVHSEQGLKNSKSAALICEDDGEELSVEHGDLEMLLGGLTAELFDSTVSVGQLKSRPGVGFVRCAGKLCGELL